MCRSQAFSFYWRLLLENWKRCEKEYLVRLRIPAWSLNAVGVSSKAIGCGTAVTIFVNPLWTPRSGSISTLYLFKNKILNTLRHQIIATIAKIVRIRRRNKVRLRGNFQKNKVRIRTKIVRIQKNEIELTLTLTLSGPSWRTHADVCWGTSPPPSKASQLPLAPSPFCNPGRIPWENHKVSCSTAQYWDACTRYMTSWNADWP